MPNENYSHRARKRFGQNFLTDPSILEKILDEIDDNENALQLARKKARSLTETEKNVFQKKIYANLKRKGFDYETIQRSVTTVWIEMNEPLEEKR